MKRVYKLTPVSLYDIRGLEVWLEDMARRGLLLKKLRPAFSSFERGPAQPLRFRAEPCKLGMVDDVPQAMLDLYQDFGWEYVCSVNNELLIFATRDPGAPEPHSDPELQGELWKKLYRAKRRDFWWQLCALIFFVGILAWILGQGGFVRSLITTALPLALLETPLLLVMLTQTSADVRQLALVVRQLEEGIPLDHRRVSLPHRWGPALTYLLLMVLLVGISSSNIIPLFTRSGVRPLDELTAFTPLSLAEVEGEGYVPRHFAMDGMDYSNSCDLDRTLLCWNQWEVVQTGRVDPDDWQRMEIHWYDLPRWLSGLSAPLARELLDSAMGLNGDTRWTDKARERVWTVTYYPQTDASLLAVADNGPDGFQAAAVARGDKAALVTYTGNSNLADYLDEIVEMVQ